METTNTQSAVIIILSLIGIGLVFYGMQIQSKRRRSAFWQQQFRNFMTQRGIISWGEAQFIPNNPPKEYVTRMTGYKPGNRYWITLDEAWQKRVEIMEED